MPKRIEILKIEDNNINKITHIDAQLSFEGNHMIIEKRTYITDWDDKDKEKLQFIESIVYNLSEIKSFRQYYN